ncbi:TPA: L,D-transpeptidase family protein [Photobacterium damselae]
MYRALLFSLMCLFSSAVNAIEFKLPDDGSNIVGTIEYYEVEKGESLSDIANKFNVGFLALLAANKDVDPFLPQPGTLLEIPTQVILPNVPHNGVTINLAELRLYYFPKDDPSKVYVFPIGIGRVGRETPSMTTSISQKIRHPTWTPTANIRKEYAAKGVTLPPVVAAGPNNPLGDYAMRLAYGHGEYLIHSTNKDFGIGMRVSSGCIRMNPWDIEWLFPQIPKGTPVRIINDPLKHTVDKDGSIIVEVHQPLSKDEEQLGEFKPVTADDSLIASLGDDNAAKQRLAQELKQQTGIPTAVN